MNKKEDQNWKDHEKDRKLLNWKAFTHNQDVFDLFIFLFETISSSVFLFITKMP